MNSSRVFGLVCFVSRTLGVKLGITFYIIHGYRGKIFKNFFSRTARPCYNVAILILRHPHFACIQIRISHNLAVQYLDHTIRSKFIMGLRRVMIFSQSSEEEQQGQRWLRWTLWPMGLFIVRYDNSNVPMLSNLRHLVISKMSLMNHVKVRKRILDNGCIVK